MLRNLCLPAIKLMDRFSFSKKLILFSVLAALVLAVLSFNLITHLQEKIQTSQTQLKGIEHLKKIALSIQSMQQHRGLISSQLADSTKSLFTNRTALKQTVNNQFELIEKQFPPTLLHESDWKTIKSGWGYLQSTSVTLERNGNFSSHTRLIEKLFRLQYIVADHYALTVLRNTGSSYLLDTVLSELITVIDVLGQIRARGGFALTSRPVAPRLKTELKILSTTLTDELKKLRITLNAAAKHSSTTIETDLRQAVEEINVSARQVASLLKSGILLEKQTISPEDFFVETTQLINIAYFHLHETIFFHLEQSLHQKVSTAKATLYTDISIALTIIFLVTYFSLGIYYSAIHSVRELSSSAKAIADGHLDTRVSLTSQDELQQVGLGFNHMAKQLTKLLDSERQSLKTVSTQQANLNAFFENMDSAVAIYEASDDLKSFTAKAINQAAEKIDNFSRENVLNKDILTIFPDSQKSGLLNILLEVSQSGVARDYPIAIYHNNNIANWREHYVFKLPNDDIVVIYKDVTKKKQSEEALELASLVYQNSSEAMMISDKDNIIIAINPAFSEMTGYSEEEAIGSNPKILSSDRHNKHFYQQMWADIHVTGEWQGEIWNKNKSGHEFLEWLTINTIRRDDGEVYRYVALFADITEKKKAEELIWQQANFDGLTNLPNRHMFQDRLEIELKKCHRTKLPLALLFLDLDHFKEINDTLGHDSGDQLLAEAGKRITHCVRESDAVARLGGDEFTIILSELKEIHVIELIADKIIHALNRPFELSNRQVYVSASIGITLYPNDADNVSNLLKNADQAMYLAKNLGRNRFCYFTPLMQEKAQSRLSLLDELHKAVEKKQFAVHYQPIIDLKTGIIQKAEALIRWPHAEKGLISPTEFIPLAEESGLITEIGDWVFKQVVQQVKQLKTTLDKDIQISVNKSPVQFKAANDHNEWLKYLEQSDVSNKNIVIEITESLLMDDQNSIHQQLKEFRESGIEISMDDFGTGYSSLSYLKKFDLDYLKIDQSFTKNLAADSDDMALSKAIIIMAHSLGLKVIAEGIETAEQMELLTNAGCDYGQGYFISRPVPADEFANLLS
jgi:diguanylate cyclase (GGDEF)-like protein/PAS domain S-box-containing protein